MPKFRLVLEGDRFEDMVAVASLAEERSIWFDGINRIGSEKKLSRIKHSADKPTAIAVLEHMKKNPNKEYYYKEFHPCMKVKGFSVNTASNVISQLVEHGKIIRTKKGYYKLK